MAKAKRDAIVETGRGDRHEPRWRTELAEHRRDLCECHVSLGLGKSISLVTDVKQLIRKSECRAFFVCVVGDFFSGN